MREPTLIGVLPNFARGEWRDGLIRTVMEAAKGASYRLLCSAASYGQLQLLEYCFCTQTPIICLLCVASQDSALAYTCRLPGVYSPELLVI